jgi:glycosyltransferase involved in cell wall biosynthesis
MSKLNKTSLPPVAHESTGSVLRTGLGNNGPARRDAVVIVGPPWPHSGTARVIENQIQYYRQRGYITVLIAVAVHRVYMRANPIMEEITKGVQSMGADYAVVAALEKKRYKITKYTATVRHGFRGNVLDWIVDIGRCAQLPEEFRKLIGALPVALVHVNHVYTLGFAERLRQQVIRNGRQVPIILDTHDVQSHLLMERGDINPWTKKQDSLECLLQTEIAMLQKVDALMHLSVDDIKFFQTHLPEKPHILSLPTIDETFVAKVNATPAPTEVIDLLFVGQSHAPNLAAMKWFFAEVWPLIAQRNYNLKIVGAVELFVRESLPKVYEEFRSCFVGQTAELAPYYRAARCVIAPMVSGSGISIKTIEALALGKPFVGTSKAYRGMPMDKIEQAGIRAYDSPRDYADALAHALAHEAEAGARSRAAYDRLFSTQAAFASRDEAFDLAMKKRHVET